MKYILLLSLILLTACNVSEQVQNNPDSPAHVLLATNYVGYHEVKDRKFLRSYLGIDPSRTEWCAAFTNSILNEAGYAGSESVSQVPLMARSFLTWGTRVKEPEIGDVVIFSRGDEGWQGHVGFYVKTVTKGGKEYYVMLGGNQGDEVSFLEYPVSKVLGIRRLNPVLHTRNPLDLQSQSLELAASTHIPNESGKYHIEYILTHLEQDL